jgi:hypothetical protein
LPARGRRWQSIAATVRPTWAAIVATTVWRPAPRRPRSTRRSGSSTVRGAASASTRSRLSAAGRCSSASVRVPARIVDASDDASVAARPRIRSISTGSTVIAPNSDAPRSPAPIRTSPNRTSGASSASSRATAARCPRSSPAITISIR